MLNTGRMVAVDLNADLAEGETVTASDLALLDTVTSASLACGFHAGNRKVMREVADACVARQVVVGAHVSYRDRQGFGRRPLDVPHEQLVEDILEQHDALIVEARAAGTTVSFVKPHGALYNRMAVDPLVAGAVVEAVSRSGGTVLVAQAGTVVVEPALRAGLRVVFEGFPDRGYLADGRLESRGRPGALIEAPEEVGRRAVSLACDGGILAVDGTWTPVVAETLCVHGDTGQADATARAVRSALERNGVVIRSPIRPGPTGSMR